MKTSLSSLVQNRSLALCMITAAAFTLPSAMNAATIQSAVFSRYYDYHSDVNGINPAWYSTTGPGGTSGTIGDFSFAPAELSSGKGSGFGVVYLDGTLQARLNANTAYSGDGGTFPDFALTLQGAYNGTPTDAAANPNYTISVVITNISIYGLVFSDAASFDFFWNETTVGNTDQSPTVLLRNDVVASTPNLQDPANYTLLSWNPGDFESAGTFQSRSFTLPRDIFIQGVNIEGYVVVNYEAIPEPGTAALVLMGCGATAFLAHRRRKVG